MSSGRGQSQPQSQPQPGSRGALEALNFFMADMQAGVGPFLGVFLQQRGWATGAIGLVMSLGGVAGMAVTAPAGALIDETTRKRLYVIVSGVATVLASALIFLSQSFPMVACSQIASAVAGAAIGPAVAGITLGIVGQRGFNAQNGRNQAFNHAGAGRVNAGQGAVMTVQGLGASLSPAIGGGIAQVIGYRAAFLILGGFALGSLLLWVLCAPLLKPACAEPGDALAIAT